MGGWAEGKRAGMVPYHQCARSDETPAAGPLIRGAAWLSARERVEGEMLESRVSEVGSSRPLQGPRRLRDPSLQIGC